MSATNIIRIIAAHAAAMVIGCGSDVAGNEASDIPHDGRDVEFGGDGMPDNGPVWEDGGRGAATGALVGAGGAGIELVFPFTSPNGCTLTRAYCAAMGPWPTDVADDGTNRCSHRATARYNDTYALDFANRDDPVSVVAVAAGTVAVAQYDAADWGNHVFVDHGGGLYSLYGHLADIEVAVGQRVRQGQTLGPMGNTGNSTGRHVHFSLMRWRASEERYEAIVPEPMSGYADFHANGRRVYGIDIAYPNLPVGTVIRARNRPEIYLVCGDMEKCHIADWDAFATRRFFYDPRDPTAQIVNVPEDALACYRDGPPVSGVSVRALIRCNGEDHLYINEGGIARKRSVPFDRDVEPYAYDALLRSWGFSRSDWRDGSFGECHASIGEDLRIRDGTLIELASDNDFYVVTADRYENEAIASADHGYVRRIRREQDGKPFMPLLYRTYNNVLMVPDDAIFTMTAGAIHGKSVFDEPMAAECRYGTISSGGAGTGTEAATVPPVRDCEPGARRCEDAATYAYCVEEPPGGTVWSVWPCPYGWVCEGSDGMCVDTESGSDTDGAGPGSDVPTNDPPHTIHCDARSDTLVVIVTGPVLDALIETPLQPFAVQYGSDVDGWVVPYLAGTKAQVVWEGEKTYVLALPAATDRFNLYVADAASASRDSWFDLDESVDGIVPWGVVGDCRRDGTVIVRDQGNGEDAGSASAGGTSDPPVTQDGPLRSIFCERKADALVISIRGPVLDALHGGTAAAPVALQYGSNTPFRWDLPYDRSSGRAIAPWEGDDATYVFELPREADGMNFFVADDSGGGRWFDLDEQDGNGVPWDILGDCVRDGTLIRNIGR